MRILYDAECGFCRRALGWVLAWDRRGAGALTPVALQDPSAAALLPGMSEERRLASWHLVDERGRVYSAGAAAAPLLRTLPGGTPLAWLAKRFPALTERAYAWVARHRGAIGRRLPGG